MNILLINHYAGTPRHGMEFRPHYMASEWARARHAVTIVAAGFSHVRQRQPLVHGAVLEETMDGIAYHWLAAPADASNGNGRVRNIWALLRLAGSHGKPNATDVLLDAARAMVNEPFAFLLVGGGHEKARLAQRSAVQQRYHWGHEEAKLANLYRVVPA